jgi:hypothetical protein
MVFMVPVWRPPAVLLAVLATAGCGSEARFTPFASPTIGPVLTAPPPTAPARSSLPSILLPSGSLPTTTATAAPAATAATVPINAGPDVNETLRAFLLTDADLPRSGIHVAAHPDNASVPDVELCGGHDPNATFAATATAGADIFTASGNGIEIVSAYPPGVAEQLMAAVTDAFGACAHSAPILVGPTTGTVSYTKVRLSVATSHKEVTAATRTVILGGATYESGLAYARFNDFVVLVQLDNIDAKTASGLLNRLLKAVVARQP